jgi:hypothetical protein
MILFLVLAGVQVGLLLLASRWLYGRMVGTGPVMAGAGRNVLVSAVRALPARGRRALYAAAKSGHLRRGTWNGCAVNRAGEMLGMPVRSRAEASVALGTTDELIDRFLEVWDGLSGSNRHCTVMLREALERAGLLDNDDVDAGARPERLLPPPGSGPASPQLPVPPPGPDRGIERTCAPRRRGRCQGAGRRPERSRCPKVGGQGDRP